MNSGQLKMQDVLIATDFSTRSDRALRRATLLAQMTSSRLTILHAVDDDQPIRLIEAEKQEAMRLLSALAATVEQADKVSCDVDIALGDPFQAIVETAEKLDSKLIVIGPHRRDLLRDIFIGTTAERTIRNSSRPIVMANAVPSGQYQRIVVATDFSDCSANAILTAKSLGLFDAAKVAAIHAFDSAAKGMLRRASVSNDVLLEYEEEEAQLAAAEMQQFFSKIDFKPDKQITQPIKSTAADLIQSCARTESADLVVIGTQGKSAMRRLFLGSVASELLSESKVDVLAVPFGNKSLQTN